MSCLLVIFIDSGGTVQEISKCGSEARRKAASDSHSSLTLLSLATILGKRRFHIPIPSWLALGLTPLNVEIGNT